MLHLALPRSFCLFLNCFQEVELFPVLQRGWKALLEERWPAVGHWARGTHKIEVQGREGCGCHSPQGRVRPAPPGLQQLEPLSTPRGGSFSSPFSVHSLLNPRSPDACAVWAPRAFPPQKSVPPSATLSQMLLAFNELSSFLFFRNFLSLT